MIPFSYFYIPLMSTGWFRDHCTPTACYRLDKLLPIDLCLLAPGKGRMPQMITKVTKANHSERVFGDKLMLHTVVSSLRTEARPSNIKGPSAGAVVL